MNRHDDRTDQFLDEAISKIRDSAPSDVDTKKATRRVWERLQAGSAAPAPAGASVALETCADYQALLDRFLARELDETHHLLVSDHFKECFECARELRARRDAQTASTSPAEQERRVPRRRRWQPLSAAAALLVAAFAGAIATQGRLPGWLVDPATVPHVSGAIYRVGDAESQPLAAGAPLAPGEWVRTAKGSGAVVELADGSRIALNERTELSFVAGWRNTEVRLARGSVLVEAAEQDAGRLFVTTNDCRVGVKGTVFSVTHGLGGSRVSVFEGAVEVDQPDDTRHLRRGDQLVTRSSLALVPLAQELAWTEERDLTKHLQFVEELMSLTKALNQIAQPQPRRSSHLLDLVPPETLFYGAVPNLSTTIAEGYGVVREKIEESEMLGEWWKLNVVDTEAEKDLEQFIDKISTYGELMGEEMVVAVGADADGLPTTFVLLADLDDAHGLAVQLENDLGEIAGVGAAVGERAWLHMIHGPIESSPPASDAQGMFVWIDDGLLAATPSFDSLHELARARGSRNANPFTQSTFHERISDRYREGAGWIFALDVATILEQTGSLDTLGTAKGLATLEFIGVANAEHLIVERKSEGDHAVHQASLFFDGPRTGLASWLTSSSPLGVLEFISPQAHLAGAFVIEKPADLLRELFDGLANMSIGFNEELARMEQEQGFRFIEDVAGPLGGEFAYALDGPLLPNPAWKIVVEVYDEEHLQQTIERAIEKLNEELVGAGRLPFELRERKSSSLQTYELRIPGSPVTPHYTYWDGYLIAAPEPLLLERAIQYRKTGHVLPNAPKFRELLSPRGPTNFSAVMYQDLGPLVSPLVESAGASLAGLSSEQIDFIRGLAEESGASLYYAYANDDRIVVADAGAGGLGSELSRLVGMAGLMSLQQQFIGSGLDADRNEAN